MNDKIHGGLRELVAFAGGFAICYGSFFGFNSIVHNHQYKSSNIQAVSKADGAFGSTEFRKYSLFGVDVREEVYISRLIGKSMFIYDGDILNKRDGLVDEISLPAALSGNRPPVTYIRTRDYKTHKKLFDDADKTLKETKERFKKYF